MIIHNPILTGSFTVNGTDVASITSSAASITAINAYTASQNILNGTYATTGSNTFRDPQTINSNLTVTGSITAATLVVQTITSSVIYSSGSNVFGNNISNTQVLTGSVTVTGSLAVVTNGTEFQVTSTGVNLGNALTDNHVISGSLRVNPNGLFVSSSGFVGIGTSSPTRQLFVNDTAFFDNIGSGSTSNPSIAIGSTSLGISYLGGSNMALIANSNTRMYISASGAVGIGATSPVGNLNLWGSGTQYVVLTNTAADGVTDAIQGGIIGQARGYGNNLAQMASILFRNKATSPWYKGEITFNTNDTDGTDPSVSTVERMRITSGGKLLVGRTATIFTSSGNAIQADVSSGGEPVLEVYNQNLSDSSPAIGCFKNSATTSSSARFIQFYSNGGTQAMGGIVGNGATNVQFASISDIREKENITSINGSLNKILSLNPVEFDWIKTGEHINAGFIAQEVEQILPEYIVENMANEGEEERKGLTGGMSSGIIAHLVKAIQELNTKFEEYKATHP